MDKNSKKDAPQAAPGRAIVAQAQNLTARPELPDVVLERAQKELRNQIAVHEGNAKMPMTYAYLLQMFGLASAAMAGGPLGAAGYLAMAAFFGAGNLYFNSQQNEKARQAFNEAALPLKESYRAAQQKAYDDMKVLLVGLADITLRDPQAQLDMAALSYLVACDAATLRKANASDALAITVLQARKALELQRAKAENSAKALTFKTAGFDAGREDHRGFLRGILEREDRKIAEDEYPAFASPEFSSDGIFEMSRGRRIKALLIGPFADIIRFSKLDYRKIKAGEDLPPLRNVPDIGSCIDGYEQGTGVRLDLPALRGWGRPKALPPAIRPR